MRKCVGNRKYIEGQVVGPYTVLGYFKPGRITCKCNTCGSIQDIFTANITRSRMCRKCRNTYNTKPREDLSGRRFGRLTVIKSVLNDKGKTAWLCECDCGAEVVVNTCHLKDGHTKSCGCYMIDRIKEANTHDLTNQRFGRLTVVERTDGHMTPGGQNLTEYVCKCDCGNYLPVLAMNLVSGNTKSCGCIGLSVGEFELETLFNQNSVNYIKEYSFCDLKSSNGGRLRFDFGIMNDDDLLCLVEFNGEQHYYEDKYHKRFGKQQREETDSLKRDYCDRHGIKLFEIRFDDDISKAVESIIEYSKNT